MKKLLPDVKIIVLRQVMIKINSDVTIAIILDILERLVGVSMGIHQCRKEGVVAEVEVEGLAHGLT